MFLLPWQVCRRRAIQGALDERNMEMDKELIDRLLELMLIKALNPDKKIAGLERAIIRAKGPMSTEQIAWVESLVTETLESEK